MAMRRCMLSTKVTVYAKWSFSTAPVMRTRAWASAPVEGSAFSYIRVRPSRLRAWPVIRSRAWVHRTSKRLPEVRWSRRSRRNTPRPASPEGPSATWAARASRPGVRVRPAWATWACTRGAAATGSGGAESRGV